MKGWKKINAKKRKNMIDVFSKREKYWYGMKRSRRIIKTQYIHHHTRLQHWVNDARYDPNPPCWQVPLAWWVATIVPLIGGWSSMCSPLRCPHTLIDAPRARCFLQRMIGTRVASSKMRSWKLLNRKKDENYKKKYTNILKDSSIKKRILISF